MPTKAAVQKPEQAPDNARRRNGRGHHRVDPQETLDSAARLACRMLKADVAAISLVDEDGYLTINSNVGMPERAAARWRLPFSEGPFGVVFRTHRPYVSMDGSLPPDLAPGLGLYGVLIVPMLIGKTLIGCLGFGYRKKRTLSSRDVELASLFANYAAIAIETAALYETESRERRRSAALLNIVRAPRPGVDLKEVLTKLCRSVLKVSVAERCAVFLLNEDRQGIEAAVALGGDGPPLDTFGGDDAVPFAIPEAISFLNQRRKPVIQEHVPGSGLLPEEWEKRFHVKSLAAYPLTCRRKPLGVLVAYTSKDFVSFSPDEVATLAAIAKQAAILIEDMRLYEREQRQRQRSETLTTVLTAATSTLSLREVLAKVCEATLALSVGDAVSIFLIDESDRRLRSHDGGRPSRAWDVAQVPGSAAGGHQRPGIAPLLPRRLESSPAAGYRRRPFLAARRRLVDGDVRHQVPRRLSSQDQGQGDWGPERRHGER